MFQEGRFCDFICGSPIIGKNEHWGHFIQRSLAFDPWLEICKGLNNRKQQLPCNSEASTSENTFPSIPPQIPHRE